MAAYETPRSLWSGVILDAKCTIATKDEECTQIIWGIENYEYAYVGTITPTPEDLAMAPEQQVAKYVAKLTAEYLRGEVARIRHLIKHHHARLQ